MTLDEAIIHCEDIVKECNIHLLRFPEQLVYKEKFYDAKSCAEEHRQLADWLKLLKRILDSKITVTQERRPCMVFSGSTNEAKGLVHCVYNDMATVELESGLVIVVNAMCVQFLDSKQAFEQYAWGGEC